MFPASPVVTYSMPSGPNLILPPSCMGPPGMPSMTTRGPCSPSAPSVYRTTLLYVEKNSEYVWYTYTWGGSGKLGASAMPSSPLSTNPVSISSTGSACSAPSAPMILTLPPRSVKKMRPSGAMSIDHGTSRPDATVSIS